MVQLSDSIKAFMKGMKHSKVSLTGAIITTVTFPILLVSVILDLHGTIHNIYFGFITYLVLGPLFIAGLLLIFIGIFFFKGKEDIGLFTFAYLKDQFTSPDRFAKLRKLIFLITALTFANIFIIALTSYSGYHFTESVGFCAQFCHSAMEPEHTAYKNSPHSRVACVECHIGKGAEWFVKSKISGSRQLLAVATGNFSRPIETPIHGLRPARETCEECHRPELFHGDKLKAIDKYLPDENNTHVQTVLLMKIGSGGYRGAEAHGIHWHVSPDNQITYRHADRGREQISEVTLSKADGTQLVFSSDEYTSEPRGENEHDAGSRLMDCIDCHNRPTHIYVGPNEALDHKLSHGEISQDLPYIKKMGYDLITQEYASQEEAKKSIATGLRTWYGRKYPELVAKQMPLLEQAIAGVQAAYTENVFPEMRIGWNTYRNFLGHKDDSGCFRCHDDSHVTASGKTISQDCDTCHIILAEEEENPEVLANLAGY